MSEHQSDNLVFLRDHVRRTSPRSKGSRSDDRTVLDVPPPQPSSNEAIWLARGFVAAAALLVVEWFVMSTSGSFSEPTAQGRAWVGSLFFVETLAAVAATWGAYRLVMAPSRRGRTCSAVASSLATIAILRLGHGFGAYLATDFAGAERFSTLAFGLILGVAIWAFSFSARGRSE